MNKFYFSLLLVALSFFLNAQQIKILNEEKKDISFRGLSVLDNGVFWVSGNKGTVGMSFNGGKTIKWVNPKGYENRDFRDIHCWDYKTAIVMAVGSPGVILKTKDGGNTWYEVFKDETENVFFDAMDFYERNENIGILVGDPVRHSHPYILITKNKGELWEKVSSVEKYPSMVGGEAFFAASGSNVKLINDSTSITISGGSASNFTLNTKPLFKHTLGKTGNETSGANGMDYSSFENYGIIVGGDFVNPDSSENNLIIFDYDRNSNPVFSKPQTAPKGYKSGVTIIGNSKALVCGTSGVDISTDRGKNWKFISPESFNVCQRAKNGHKVYLAGQNGIIGILIE